MSVDSDLAELPDSWKYQPLGELVDEDRGISYGIVQPGSHINAGVPIVRVNNIKNGRIDTSDALRVSDEIESKYARTRLRGGEVLLTLVGSLGESAVVHESLQGWNVAQAVGVIPVKPEIGARWVELCLRSSTSQHCIRTWATTTVQATLNLRDVDQLPIPIPPKREREAIAGVLGALDDKIKLNRRMNETLEALARATFTSWFVDTTANELPKGWKREAVSNACHIVTRGVTPNYQEGSGRFIINQRVNRGFELDWSELKELHPDLEVPTEKFAQQWDVLVNCLGEGTLGRTHLYLDESSAYAVDQHMSICRPKFPAMGTYLYQVLSSPEGQAQIESLKTGSTGMTMFNISKLREFDFICPPDELLKNFFKTVEPMFLRIALNRQESRTLAALRDALLPKLLSGVVRVRTERDEG